MKTTQIYTYSLIDVVFNEINNFKENNNERLQIFVLYLLGLLCIKVNKHCLS